MEKTENYKWSSYGEYVGKEKIINRSILLHYFGNSVEEFKKFTLINDDKEQIYYYADFELITKLSEDELSNIIMQKFDLKNASDVSLLEKENMGCVMHFSKGPFLFAKKKRSF